MSITIITPGRFIDGEAPEARCGLEGWFTLRAKDRWGRVRRERTFPTHNLITDLGLDRFGSENANSVYNRCHVGLGVTPPQVTDNQLANFLANVQTGSPSQTLGTAPAPDYYSWRRIEFTSAIGALGNNNLTEVGISGQNTNGLLFSRDLIKDSGGNPSAFPISDDEQLTVIYELRIYPPLSDSSETVSVGANTHDTLSRARNVTGGVWGLVASTQSVNNFSRAGSGHQGAYSGDLVAIDANQPSGSLGSASSGSVSDYNNGDHYRDVTNVWNIGTGNGDIRTVVFTVSCCSFQCQYDPPITKTSDQTLTLHQRISWGRR